jgi:hypothetical protein
MARLDGDVGALDRAPAPRRAPELQIIVPLEGNPWARLDAATHEDELRLLAWLRGPGALGLYSALLALLEALHEEERAA